MHALSKKGQSLVEVIVALGILAVVFAGVISLIVRVVDLELMARDRTIAVSYAQQVLAETIGKMGNGCSETADDTFTGSRTEGNEFSYTGTIKDSPDYSNGLDQKSFKEVTITVKWKDKSGLTNTYELKQAVKK